MVEAKSSLPRFMTIDFFITWTLVVAGAVGLYWANDARSSDAINQAALANKKADELHKQVAILNETHYQVKTEIALMKSQVKTMNEKIGDTNQGVKDVEEKIDRLLERLMRD